jgi:hypothetical protein
LVADLLGGSFTELGTPVYHASFSWLSGGPLQFHRQIGKSSAIKKNQHEQSPSLMKRTASFLISVQRSKTQVAAQGLHVVIVPPPGASHGIKADMILTGERS